MKLFYQREIAVMNLLRQRDFNLHAKNWEQLSEKLIYLKDFEVGRTKYCFLKNWVKTMTPASRLASLIKQQRFCFNGVEINVEIDVEINVEIESQMFSERMFIVNVKNALYEVAYSWRLWCM